MTSRRRAPAIPPDVAEYLSWERLRERIDANPHLYDQLRREALAMIGKLEAVLGPTWPVRAYTGSGGNSLTECLVNGAPFAVRSMVSAGHALVGLRDTAGWRRVVGRIPSEGEAAIAELRVAWRAAELGMSVALSPPTERGQSADVLVTYDATRLFVEVFVAEPLPRIAFDTEELEDRIIPRFTPLTMDLSLGGSYLRAPTEDEVAPLAAAVESFLTMVHRSHGVHRLLVPGLLDLRATRFDDPDYQSFVDQRLIGDFHGIVFQHSPLGRLRSAVLHKSRQLPAAGLGMLVMTPPHFLGQPPPTEELVAMFQKVLSTLPNVVAIALIGRQMVQPATSERMDLVSRL
jgi:hypothetical protein